MTNLNHWGVASAAMSLVLLSGGCAGTIVNDSPVITPSRSISATPATPSDHTYDEEDPELDDEPAPLLNAARPQTGLPRG